MKFWSHGENTLMRHNRTNQNGFNDVQQSTVMWHSSALKNVLLTLFFIFLNLNLDLIWCSMKAFSRPTNRSLSSIRGNWPHLTYSKHYDRYWVYSIYFPSWTQHLGTSEDYSNWYWYFDKRAYIAFAKLIFMSRPSLSENLSLLTPTSSEIFNFVLFNQWKTFPLLNTYALISIALDFISFFFE